MKFQPRNDGVDHVNVYSRGRTVLGQYLSNFAATPFVLNGLQFASVEGWWYWRKTGVDHLRLLTGYAAKAAGRDRPALPGVNDPGKDELLQVYQAKVDQNEPVKRRLRENRLPFDHYYVNSAGMRVDTRYRWTGLLWSEVRT